MTTYIITHDSFFHHKTPNGHPERVERIDGVIKAIKNIKSKNLIWKQAQKAQKEHILLAHTPQYLKHIEKTAENAKNTPQKLDPDTYMSEHSLNAAYYGVGALIQAVDAVCTHQAHNAFCAVRPPGHHAEKNKAMGFCIFSNAAIAALYARKKYHINKIAIIDFDVHHGNGTQNILWSEKELLFISTHQMPLYPGTGSIHEKGEDNHGHIINIPLRNGDGTKQFKQAFENIIIPQIDRYKPELIIISAGFDAHKNDPLAGLLLDESDFKYATQMINEYAKKYCQGKIISTLEGGYDLKALHDSVKIHVETLLREN